MRILYTILFTAMICLPASATIINIPDDYETIQEGIDASTDGDTVLVQPGEYVENINFNGQNIVLGSLYLMTGDTTYIAETVIDGDSSGSVVTFESGEDSTAILSGFTIQNGNTSSGGGILFKDHSNPIISNNRISENHAFQGGGIHCRISNPVIRGNTIKGNSTSAEGGGIWCDSSNPTISNNTISENSACCGGGVFCYAGSDLIIRNNTISGNSVSYYGGGINFFASNSVVSNNTISENSGSLGGGVFLQNDCNVNVVNTIFWGNNASDNGNEVYILYGSISITFCDIEGGWEGEGNIDCDPLFCDPEEDNFYLAENSCCVGSGENGEDIGAFGIGCEPTAIDEDGELPSVFSCFQNYPNPFNAFTIIRYTLPSASDVTIDIYDILGRRVETLIRGEQPAGYHQIVWDASDRSSGIYFYTIRARDHSETRKMILIK